MDLALATGRGPAVVVDLEGRRPLVRDEDVVAFGRRDAEDAKKYRSQRIEDTAIRVFDLAEIRKCGAAEAARQAIDHLSRPELSGFWMHLDADVVDDAVIQPIACQSDCRGTIWRQLLGVATVLLRAEMFVCLY